MDLRSEWAAIKLVMSIWLKETGHEKEPHMMSPKLTYTVIVWVIF